MSKVAVFGGAGYIGSFASQELIEAGHEVEIFDNLSAGHREVANILNVPLFEGDLASPDAIHDFLTQGNFDAVMQFAALTSVPDSQRDPLSYTNANLINTYNLLSALREVGPRVIIFSSTAAVYGNPVEGLTFNEEHPKAPINHYGETKLEVEWLLRNLARSDAFRAIALRYFNAAGGAPDGSMGEDHNPETHMMANAVRAALGITDKPMSLFGTDYPTRDGTCERDYIHVKDLASAHRLALESLLRDETPRFDVFNIGTGKGATNLEVIKAVEEVSGREVPYTVAERRAGDPPVLVADSTKLQETLGWKPQYTSIVEIARTAHAWFKKNPNGYPSN